MEKRIIEFVYLREGESPENITAWYVNYENDKPVRITGLPETELTRQFKEAAEKALWERV